MKAELLVIFLLITIGFAKQDFNMYTYNGTDCAGQYQWRHQYQTQTQNQGEDGGQFKLEAGTNKQWAWQYCYSSDNCTTVLELDFNECHNITEIEAPTLDVLTAWDGESFELTDSAFQLTFAILSLFALLFFF
ncbi:hypothetical protein M0811_01821 [Anaeramoeba ignava]|uniref:Uncharacterized protein n=1 Tax=Anaeramoeba ignava TaxID=1746090 RepID=A0A9Q0LE97_ANAIG|nr:hypothetical protein M0811_01821 [Anaeramoeba ignava]|eukprot:Anaeramoba_ignava/a225241_20.p1 GENE.a225241_20~~a225241_20.p1  ORF type:complete len:133 (+),score=49.48 a225241_20:58-456(+)